MSSPQKDRTEPDRVLTQVNDPRHNPVRVSAQLLPLRVKQRTRRPSRRTISR